MKVGLACCVGCKAYIDKTNKGIVKKYLNEMLGEREHALHTVRRSDKTPRVMMLLNRALTVYV